MPAADTRRLSVCAGDVPPRRRCRQCQRGIGKSAPSSAADPPRAAADGFLTARLGGQCFSDFSKLAAILEAILGEIFAERGKQNPPTTSLFDNRSPVRGPPPSGARRGT